MSNYYVKRLVSVFFTLFLIATITFFLMRAIPGGPFTRERPVSPAILANLEERYNLNDPLIVQYYDYMKGLVTFDLGPSYKILGTTVNELIAEGFPTSAKVGGLAVILIVTIGVPIGIISALKPNSIIDYIVMFGATLGVTLPSFVIATGIIYIFAVNFELIPATGLGSWKGYIGPVIALSGYSLSFVARLTRSSMLEVLRQDYVRTARANGISEFKVIFKHALKNALIPVITYIGPMVAAILTGSFVIEKVFDLPGMGTYFVDSVSNRDYTVVMGMTVFYAAFYVIMVFFVDIAYSLIDPRIKLDS
jgi:oligopeptide transport system permease protein